MKVEEKFNRKTAKLVPVKSFWINAGPQYAEGIKVTFSALSENDPRAIAIHLTHREALELAEQLLSTSVRVTK